MIAEAKGHFLIENNLGLHARAATKLVQIACKYPCEVTVKRDGQSANGKSVMGVLLLCAAKGSEIDVSALGDGAQDCVNAIRDLIANKFGEAE